MIDPSELPDIFPVAAYTVAGKHVHVCADGVSLCVPVSGESLWMCLCSKNHNMKMMELDDDMYKVIMSH